MIVLITSWNRSIRNAFDEYTELHTVIRWGWQNQRVNLGSVLIWSERVRGGNSFKRHGIRDFMPLIALGMLFYLEDRAFLPYIWLSSTPCLPPHLLICCSGTDTKKLGTQVDCCIIIIFRLITVVIILTNVFKCWSDLFQQCNTYHMRNFLDFRTSLSLCGGNPGFWDPFFWYGLGESVCWYPLCGWTYRLLAY